MSAWETIGQSDEWRTPAYVFDALETEFDLDPCSPETGPDFVPATEKRCSLGISSKWSGLTWLNPPFGGRNGLAPWLEKFFLHHNGVALVPDRTSAPWFQAFAPRADAILFVSPKIKFIRPDGSIGKWPGTGTALMAAGDDGLRALRRGHRNGLGLLVKNYA